MKSKALLMACLIFFSMGTTKVFSQAPTSIKAIQAISDPGLPLVDIVVSSFGLELAAIDNFPYLGAIPATSLPFGGLPVELIVSAPGSSVAIDTFEAVLPAEAELIIAGIGVVDPGQFAPNPDGLDISLQPAINDNARSVSETAGNVEFTVVHGVTDAGTIDVVSGGTTLVDDLSFSEFSAYASIPAGNYTLEITGSQGTPTLAAFSVNLTDFADSALTVIATGFLDPDANQGGGSIFLASYASADSVPTLIPNLLVGIEHDVTPGVVETYSLSQNYPNPFNPSTTIEFAMPAADAVNLAIYNTQGQLVETLLNTNLGAGTHQVRWEPSNLPSGVYFYRLATKSFTQTKKLMLLK